MSSAEFRRVRSTRALAADSTDIWTPEVSRADRTRVLLVGAVGVDWAFPTGSPARSVRTSDEPAPTLVSTLHILRRDRSPGRSSNGKSAASEPSPASRPARATCRLLAEGGCFSIVAAMRSVVEHFYVVDTLVSLTPYVAAQSSGGAPGFHVVVMPVLSFWRRWV